MRSLVKPNVTCCMTAGSVKGTWRVKTFMLLLGDMCSMMLKPLALQSAMDKTSKGKVMLVSATSDANCPRISLNICSAGTVSVEGAEIVSVELQSKKTKKKPTHNSLSISWRGWGIKWVAMWKKTLYLVSSRVASSVQSSSSIGSIM